MEGNLIEGLKLMVIGMSTVFLILIIIILFGNALISFVNKFLPEEETPKAKTSSNSDAIDPQVSQAIAMAVANLTGGKGKVEKIEKL